MDDQQPSALEGLRVVELAQGVAGPFGARLLADFGADVVKVELPGDGDVARKVGPFADHNESALFAYLNWNKRSIELDLRDPASRSTVDALVSSADIVVDGFRPGRLGSWGIGYEQMRDVNPAVVVVSVTNFGQAGPWADWEATDLIFYATGGIMSFSGKKHPRMPLKHGLRQSLYCAGLNVAYLALAGYFRAQATGTGEHIDLSIRDVVVSGLPSALGNYSLLGIVSGRHPIVQDPFGGDPLDTGDGYVSMQASRAASMDQWASFLRLPALRDERFANSAGRVRYAAELRDIIEKRLASTSAARLFDEATSAGLLIGLIQGARELLNNKHLAERRMFVDLPGIRAGGHAVRVAGELAKLSATPAKIRFGAPGLGGSTDEILAELGSGVRERRYSDRRSPVSRSARDEGLPLQGIRVVDLSAIVAGPYIGALLADLGAEVIKVEGPGRLDTSRGLTSRYIDNIPGDQPYNRAANFQGLNRGKRSFICDLGKGEGRAVLRQLLGQADVLIENFRPRVLRGWGFTPEVLREINPRLITLSNSGFGASGPWRDFPAQGTTLELTMGCAFYSGYKGGRPSKVGQSYPDFVACWSGLLAVMVALVNRERSGSGQWIDQGMLQLGSAIIPEALLHYQISGSELTRQGPSDIDAVFSGVYESLDQDVWVAVSVRSASDVGRLLNMLPHGDDMNVDRPDFNGLEARLASWIAGRPASDAVDALQGARIPAGRVLDVGELFADPQLAERDVFEVVRLGVGEERVVVGRPYRFLTARSVGCGPRIRRPSPDFGADNRYVLRKILKMNDDAIRELYREGVVADQPVSPPVAEPTDLQGLVARGEIARLDAEYRSRALGQRKRMPESFAGTGLYRVR